MCACTHVQIYRYVKLYIHSALYATHIDKHSYVNNHFFVCVCYKKPCVYVSNSNPNLESF